MCCGYPCYPCAALCACGGSGPSGFYDPCFGSFNGPFNSWCGPSGPGFWAGERPGIKFEPHLIYKPLITSPLGGVLDFAMSSWVMLTLTFGLSKLVLLGERQAKKYLKRRKSLKLVNTVLPFCQQNKETMDPVVVEENTALREQLSSSNSLLGDARVTSRAGPSKSSSSQECAQFGDDGEVEPAFYSDHNFSMELCRQASMYARKQSEFLQVWGKYISEPKERPMIAGMRCNNNSL